MVATPWEKSQYPKHPGEQWKVGIFGFKYIRGGGEYRIDGGKESLFLNKTPNTGAAVTAALATSGCS